MRSDEITFFIFFKEDKVAFNQKKHIGYIKIFIHHYNGYLKIFIHHYKNMFYTYKKNISINTFKEMIWHLEKCDTLITSFG